MRIKTCPVCGHTWDYEALIYNEPYDRYDCPLCGEDLVSGEIFRGEWRIRLLEVKT